MGADLVLTEKDKIEQFKRDLRSYKYHQKMIDELQWKIEELSVKIEGVSSPTVKPAVIENGRDPYKDKKNEYWHEEEALVIERNKHLNEITKIDNYLSKVEEGERRILVDVYINRKRIDSLDYVYLSIAQTKRTIDKIIKRILQDDTQYG